MFVVSCNGAAKEMTFRGFGRDSVWGSVGDESSYVHQTEVLEGIRQADTVGRAAEVS